ncbi:MAG: hypothetical protein Q9227_001849 [Pyrenula ochraceoflavens]
MKKLSGKAQEIRTEIQTDENLNKAKRYARRGAENLPSAALEYVVEKLPIAQWLPRYAPRWLINDVVAGLTLGIMMIPQALAYAKIATIPGQFGLMASWIPGLLYAFMGTSKDLSVGPTSIISLLTAGIIRDFSREGLAPEVIAATVAFMIGVYAFALGLFKLGFILDFISVPVLTGFISGVAITILLGQVDSLLGEKNVGDGTATIIHDVFAQLPQASGPTIAIGFSGIVLLVALQWAGTRWGKRYKVIWLLSISRAAIVLLIYTIISFFLNRHRRDDPIFSLSKVSANGISAPRLPNIALAGQIATRAVAPFVSAALEHLAIGKGFARKNDYVIDESQELVYLGAVNVLNSVFSGYAVGGAMSRTAVNSECGVKSPLSGIITSGFILLAIYELTGALFWIPSATLAAIIVTAVWGLIGPTSAFYRFWRTSFADFVASMLSFWITVFVSAEIGIAAAVGFSVAYTLLRAAFARVSPLEANRLINAPYLGDAELYSPRFGGGGGGGSGMRGEQPTALPYVPTDTQVFRFTQPIIFPNAYRVKGEIWENIQVYTAGSNSSSRSAAAASSKSAAATSNTAPSSAPQADRSWSVAGERRVRKLRARIGITNPIHAIRVLVLDMSSVAYIDSTGVTALKDLKADLKKFAGPEAEVRFAGLSDGVKGCMVRSGWKVVDSEEAVELGTEDGSPLVVKGDEVVDVAFAGVKEAVRGRRGGWPKVAWEEKRDSDMVYGEAMGVAV